jgi:ribonuclease HI
MIICHFDGSINPNPYGKMGWGCVIRGDKILIKEKGSCPPSRDNTVNVAEYIALRWVLDTLIENNLQNEEIIIRGDSLMVVNQMNNKWKIHYGNIYTGYAIVCRRLLPNFPNLKIEWVPRKKNYEADDLSKV